MERILIEYAANALWQLPLLAGAAWLLLRIVRATPLVQHRVWLTVLFVAALLPLRSLVHTPVSRSSARTAIVFAHMPISIAVAMPAVPQTPPSRPVEAPRKRRAAGIQTIHLSWATMLCLLWFYVATVIFSVFRMAWGWRAARRLVTDARKMTLPVPALRIFETCGERLGIPLPELRESSQISSPMIVGARRPVLLLPECFLRHADAEIEAALCHELAHVERRDYLRNLLCQTAALPLAWHPANYAVQRRIRNTREMICDAIAAQQMRSEMQYARCLVTLAQSMVDGPRVGRTQALGLFDNSRMEERVMSLMKPNTRMSSRAKVIHGVGGLVVVAAAIAVTSAFHLRPVMAQSQSPAQSKAQAQVPAAAPVAISGKPALSEAELGIPGLVAIVHGRNATISKRKGQLQQGEFLHSWMGADGKPFTILNHDRQEPTPGQQHRMEKAFARRIATMNTGTRELNRSDMQRQVKQATAQINSPEFKHQMAEVQKQIRSGELQRHAQEAGKQAEMMALNSADIQRQIQEATVQINSNPEFKRQMAEVQKQIRSGELQRHAQEAAKQAEMMALNSTDMQRQVKEATAQINSPEFKRQMAEVQAEVQKELKNGQFERGMDLAELNNNLKNMDVQIHLQGEGNTAQMDSCELERELTNIQHAVQNGELQRDKAIQALKDAQKNLENTPAK